MRGVAEGCNAIRDPYTLARTFKNYLSITAKKLASPKHLVSQAQDPSMPKPIAKCSQARAARHIKSTDRIDDVIQKNLT